MVRCSHSLSWHIFVSSRRGLPRRHREIRSRDAHLAQREADLLEREAAVYAREQAVLSREAAAHAAADAARESEAKLAQAWAAHRAQVYHAQTQAQQRDELRYAHEGRENVRPGVQGVEPEVVARVASRPSMVPRPPLNERRSSVVSVSGGGGMPFPRVNSSSSLMSLDDTPTKDPSPSLRRRLASKSMHNLQGAAGHLGTPTRSHSASNDNLRGTAASHARRSPSLITIPVAAPLPTSISVHEFHTVPNSPTRPTRPSPTLSATSASSAASSSSSQQVPAVPPIHARHLSSPAPSSGYSSPASTVYTYDDDVPSPFLKKPASSAPGRLAPAPASGTASRPSKGPMFGRFLASRAMSLATGGGGGGGEGSGSGGGGAPPSRRASLAPRKSIGV